MLPQANIWKAKDSIKRKLAEAIGKKIDYWENKSSVSVSFNLLREGAYLNGEFTAKELSDIAGIIRKIEVARNPDA